MNVQFFWQRYDPIRMLISQPLGLLTSFHEMVWRISYSLWWSTQVKIHSSPKLLGTYSIGFSRPLKKTVTQARPAFIYLATWFVCCKFIYWVLANGTKWGVTIWESWNYQLQSKGQYKDFLWNINQWLVFVRRVQHVYSIPSRWPVYMCR